MNEMQADGEKQQSMITSAFITYYFSILLTLFKTRKNDRVM